MEIVIKLITDVIKFITDHHLGDLASVLALIITVCGFVITILAVRKSRKAIQAVRADMAQFDAVSELSAALAAIEEIKYLHREEGWKYISPRYSGLRKSLIEIRGAHPDLSSQDRNPSARYVITHLVAMENQVDRALVDNTIRLDVPNFNAIISRQGDHLNEMLAQIKNKIGR